MFVLLTYDVSTVTDAGKSRLRRVAKECVNYGIRVQNSVFELVIEPSLMKKLENKLEKIIDKEQDSIRIYHLGTKQKPQIIGKGIGIKVEEPLII